MKCRTNLKSRQGGAVAVLVGISIVVLVGFLGLAVDLGHLYVAKTELQNAADACALSAVRELSNLDSSALGRATNAGIVAGGGCPAGLNSCPSDAFRNKTDLQAATVDIQPADVTYSATYGGTYDRTDPLPADTKYVRCAPHETNPKSYVMWFMQVLGIKIATVGAEAIAKLSPSQSACAIPVGICTTQTSKASPAPQWGFVQGNWYDGLATAQNGYTGNYGWIDFDPSAGGTNTLKEQLAGEGKCEVPASGLVGEQGAKVGADAAWNTRFGLYKANDVPWTDKTGFAYTPKSWPAQNNAYADFQNKREVPYQGDVGTGLSLVPPYKISSSDAYKKGSDRRVVAAPIVRCQDWVSGTHRILIRDWACMLMLAPLEGPDGAALEFLGLAGESGSPCASLGLPGSGIGSPLVPTLVK